MYDEKKFLILQYETNFDDFKNITSEVEALIDKNLYFEIKYKKNIDKYNFSKSKLLFYQKPQIIDLANIDIYHKGRRLSDYQSVLKFDQWYKVFYKSGKISVYKLQNLKIYVDEKKNAHLSNYFDYLESVALNISKIDNNDFLLNQLKKLVVLKESCIYKFLKGELENKKDEKPLILPFTFNNSQKSAVKIAMENDLSIIQGPPGTGKTQTILNIIANCIYRKQSVAVVSSNNSATQNVYEKMKSEGYGFLNAFIGKDDNIIDFFARESDEINIQGTNYLINIEDSELSNIENYVDQSLALDLELARTNQLIQEYTIEKQINDAEYCVKNNDIPKEILRKNYTCGQFLNFAAYLETLPLGKITGFFYRARLLFRYGILNIKSISKHRNEVIEYLKSAYYDKKIEELTLKKQSINKSIKDISAIYNVSLYRKKSRDLFHQFLKEHYDGVKFADFTKLNYKNLFPEFVKRFPIVYSTTHALRSCSEKNFLYDYVIIDESSQVDLITATIAFSCAKRVVLVGDLMQISHVVSTKLSKLIDKSHEKFGLHKCFDYVSNNILKAAKTWNPQIPSTLLCEHYRCDPQIIGFCNKRFYDNQLVIKTKHCEGGGVTILSHRSHKENDRANETEAESIANEIIPLIQSSDFGIIAPYNNQIKLLKERLPEQNNKIETVHKFQGRECDNIILSAVADRIRFYEDDDKMDFMNNPNLINVAISRAKKRLFISVSEEILKQNGTILRDLSNYYQFYCSGTKITKSKIYSVFDLMYNDYAPILENMNQSLKSISLYKSENIIATLIEEIIKSEDKKFAAMSYFHNYPLKFVLKSVDINDEEDLKFINNIHTHCDFVIYNTLDKNIELVIEVDGKTHADPKQKNRDERKDRLLTDAGIKLLRLPTTTINCKEKIIEKLLSN